MSKGRIIEEKMLAGSVTFIRRVVMDPDAEAGISLARTNKKPTPIRENRPIRFENKRERERFVIDTSFHAVFAARINRLQLIQFTLL